MKQSGSIPILNVFLLVMAAYLFGDLPALERELKVELTQNDFEGLKNHWSSKFQHRTDMENLYLDTKKQKIKKQFHQKIRLRFISGSTKLTIKGRPLPNNPLTLGAKSSLVQKPEFEVSLVLPQEECKKMLNTGVPQLLDTLLQVHPLFLNLSKSPYFHQIQVIGKNSTERYGYKISLGIEGGKNCWVYLDKTHYGKHVGYELELEFGQRVSESEIANVEEGLKEIFKTLNIPYRPSKFGKRSRTLAFSNNF